MKSALELEKESFRFPEVFNEHEKDRIDVGGGFDGEAEDFYTELIDFESQEEVRRGRGLPSRSGRFRSSRPRRPSRRLPRPPRHPRPRRRRYGRAVVEPGLVEGPAEGQEYTRWVQDSLNRILDLRLPVDGVMGPETRSAVRRFQARERLPVTGIVGPDTERALSAALQKARPAEPAEPEPVEGEFADLELETGADRSHPSYVRWIQQSLNRIMGLRLAADGRIGPKTRSAIRSFQQRRGLRTDGVVGDQTERALIAAGAGRPPVRIFMPPPRMPTPPAPTVPFGRRCRFPFTLTAVEARGGGRVRDKTPPRRAEVVEVKGVGGRRIHLRRLAAAAWQAMVKAARSDGIAQPLLLPTSGFRDPEHQRKLWEKALRRYGSAEEARKWVAPPGNSAHQSGRAIDLYLGGKNDSRNVANLRRLPPYRWLVENAICFGFYPYEREPWHWEYNPPRTPSREFEIAEMLMPEGVGAHTARVSSC